MANPAKRKFSNFLSSLLYENDEEKTTATTEVEEVPPPELTQEDIATFEVSMSAEGEEDIVEMAKKIIVDSQTESDNDEFPDISNVQSVLDTAGTDADHELICKILMNFVHCNPADLEQDGIKRRQAIMDAIEQTKQKSLVLKNEKADEEQALVQAEKDAEVACREAISQANIESERAIEEEKARSAAIIAEIRQRTDSATENAKQQRDATLESIAVQRAENEAVISKSNALVSETEKQGQIVISKIDTWLGYLK